MEKSILFWGNIYFPISISPNFINVFSIFIHTFKNFYIFLIYNLPLFSFKLEFEVNLQLQNCSWCLVLQCSTSFGPISILH